MEGNPESSTFKTFVCHICGRMFIRNHRLQSHIRTHKKIKPGFTSAVTDNPPSTQDPTEHQSRNPSNVLETSSEVQQSELLQNVTLHNKDFNEYASNSPMTNDLRSQPNHLKEEDGSRAIPPLKIHSNSKENSSQYTSVKLTGNIASLSVSGEYQSCRSLMESKNSASDKSNTTIVTKLDKIPLNKADQTSQPVDDDLFINACDVDVILSETVIHNNVETRNEVQIKTSHEVASESPSSQLPKKAKVVYVCEVCQRTFSNKAHHERHILVHTKEKPHVCPVCSRRFAQVGNLNAHLRTHYEKEENDVDEPDISPEAISGAFPKVRKLTVRAKETVFYCCEVCNMQFSSKCYLVRHALTHTKEKPHVCNVCFRGFAQIGNLNVHYRTHTNLKNFVCHVCDKSFTLMGSLKAHLLTHMEKKPFECDVCGRGFSSKCFLKRHYFTHTNFKPYVCNVCQRGFVQVGNLNVHLLTHLNQSSFRCDVCDKTFARKLYLDRHCKVHANGNGKVYTVDHEKAYSKENDIDYSTINDNTQMVMNDNLNDNTSVC